MTSPIGSPANALRKLVLPALATLIVCAILVALGVWQLERLAWKEALIARVASALSAAPVAAPGPGDWPALDLAAREYQPVTVAGAFLNTVGRQGVNLCQQAATLQALEGTLKDRLLDLALGVMEPGDGHAPV